MIRLVSIIILGACLSLPAFLGDFFVAHDLLFHLNWNKNFTEQFWAGDIYPRWLANMNGGRGSPVFFFYGPVPFFVSALFKPLLVDDPHGWLQLGLSISAALVLSGLFAYLWLRKIVDKWSAFMAAIVYMILPYHLLVNLYQRLSLAEFWSFAWMPLILYATREIVDKKDNGILKFSLGYALLVMTHLPATMIFSLIPPAYAVVISKKKFQIKNLILVLTSISIGIGLSSIYLIPVLFTQKNVNLSLMTVGSWKYDYNFLEYLSKSDGVKNFSIYIYQVTVFTLLIGVSCYFKIIKSQLSNKYENTFWLMVIGMSFFLMFPVSGIIWENVSIIQNIQFPWRFNILISLATPALIAAMLRTEYNLNDTLFSTSHLAVTGLIVVLVYLGLSTSLNISNEHIKDELRYVTANSLDFNLGAPEYLPRWVPVSEKEKFISGTIDHAEMVINNVKNRNVTLIKNEPRSLEIEVSGITDGELTISQFYYPGWTAILKDQEEKLPVKISKEGLLDISVPSGRHIMLVKLESTIEERLGQVISFIFVFSCGVMYMRRKLVSGHTVARAIPL
jgi:hypothetical protein